MTCSYQRKEKTAVPGLSLFWRRGVISRWAKTDGIIISRTPNTNQVGINGELEEMYLLCGVCAAYLPCGGEDVTTDGARIVTLKFIGGKVGGDLTEKPLGSWIAWKLKSKV